MSELRANVIVNPNDWTKPQVGTPTQHRAITKIGKRLGYTSMIEFLNSWRDYKTSKEADGSLRPLQTHWIFKAQRDGLIVPKGITPYTQKRKV